MVGGAPLRLASGLRSSAPAIVRRTHRAPTASSWQAARLARPQSHLFSRQQHTSRAPTIPTAAAARRAVPPRQQHQSRLTTAASTSAPNTRPEAEGVGGGVGGGAGLATGLSDTPAEPLPAAPSDAPVDWSRSFHGLSATAFGAEARAVLLRPVDAADVEIKPDGIVYLPEIKYRRILNTAFGPGAWGLAPRGEMSVSPKTVSREYGLVVQGRGEQQYFDPEGVPTATEGCKSNALMRCCKDLGVASELWDPVFIRKFMANHVKEVWVEHMTTKKKRKIFLRKDVAEVPYPYKAV